MEETYFSLVYLTFYRLGERRENTAEGLKVIKGFVLSSVFHTDSQRKHHWRSRKNITCTTKDFPLILLQNKSNWKPVKSTISMSTDHTTLKMKCGSFSCKGKALQGCDRKAACQVKMECFGQCAPWIDKGTLCDCCHMNNTCGCWSCSGRTVKPTLPLLCQPHPPAFPSPHPFPHWKLLH